LRLELIRTLIAINFKEIPMTQTRRTTLQLFAAALAAAPLAGCAPTRSDIRPVPKAPNHGHDAHSQAMAALPPSWTGKEQIAMVVYPGMTALDLVGPQYFLGSLMGATVHLVAEDLRPVMTDTRFAIVPTTTFTDCPADLDVLLVPGGCQGTLEAAKDLTIQGFLRDRGKRAKLITSVCTGSMVLGVAGLLRGYRATSHWVTRDLLSRFGAEAVDARVVVDRNRMTAAGVSAGIDLGLTIVKNLRDEEYARSIALLAEYAPEPPVDAGTPQRAGKATTDLMATMFTGLREQFVAVAASAAP
jgi:cyclohexyl-isocyanide hydratase